MIARQDDIKAFFDKVDTDKDGTVDYDEFMTFLEEILSERYSG